MSKLFRIVVSALAGLAGAIVFVPGVAFASLSADVNFSFPATSFTVGETDVEVELSFTNDNDAAEAGLVNTVCNTGESNPPCDDAGTGSPANDKGINFILSCGSPGLTVCGAGGADPGVFQPEATGIGSGACVGRIFSIVESDATFGTLRFEPQGPAAVTLDPGATCTITFEVDVVAYPLLDQDPGTAGQQTGQIADVLMYSASLDAYDSDSSLLTVERATPTIATQASGTVGLDSTISDTAFVSGREFPDATGTVDFRLYGPDDDDCSGTPVFQDLGVALAAAATSVTSADFSPTAQGTYRWVAAYSGDRNNDPVAGACNDANESVVITEAQPTIVTTASADQPLGAGTLTDAATVSGRVGAVAGSTVDFSLYGPDDATCSTTPVFTSSIAMATDADVVTSGTYTPDVPGTYRWVAAYSGDANNLPAAGACNDDGESTVVTKAEPEITTEAGPDLGVGGELSDKATVTGLVSPLGSSVDFSLYGPDDTTCARTPVLEANVPLAAGDTMATSPSFTTTVAGTYSWVATYNGDANNESVAGECGDPAETVQVLSGAPTITTQASPGVTTNGAVIFDTATVTDRVLAQPGAAIDFRLYGPGDATCERLPVFESLAVSYPVAGGSVRSAVFTPTVAGTYRWVATYTGDENNASVSGECGDPAEMVEVTLDLEVELPATGSETGLLLRSGGGILIAGLAMLGLGGRRRRPQHS